MKDVSVSSSRPELRAVLLDLDGTLVDSEGLAAQILENYLREHRLVRGRERELSFSVVGRTWRKGVEEAVARGVSFGVPLDLVERELILRYRDSLERTGVPEVAGAARAVQALSKRFSVAVVSGSQRAEIELNLKRLGVLDEVRFFLGAEDVPNGKPEPDPFLEACRRLSIPPESCVVFEDSRAGILSALSARIGLVVAVEAANRGGQDQAQADLRVPDWKGVDVSWLEGVWALRLTRS
jgi:HAD superfamily hydrolase (TIGR01509 family)